MTAPFPRAGHHGDPCLRRLTALVRNVRSLCAGLLCIWGLLAMPASAQRSSLDGNPDALTVSEDLSPVEARNALARAGYLTNLTGFQNAVEVADTVAIPLFQAAGFELTGDMLRSYVNPLYSHGDRFDPEVGALLARGGIDRRDFCIDPSGTWDQYFAAQRPLDHQESRLDFIRSICGSDDIVRAIRALLYAEELELAALTLANDSRPDRIAACVETYRASHPVGETVRIAEGYSLFDVDRVTPPHDTVIMELSSWHQSGREGSAEAAYAQAVENGCAAAIEAHVINTAERDRLAAVLTILRPDEIIDEGQPEEG